MMPELKMPKKGEGLAMLQELNATHAELDNDNTVSNVTTLQPSNEETLQSENVTTNERASDTNSEPTGHTNFEGSNVTTSPILEEERTPAVKTPTKSGAGRTNTSQVASTKSSTGSADDRTARFRRAMQLAQDDETAVVTVRTPARLNEYMDRYVERVNRLNPKRKYRKQDAVMEAFAAFFADHPMPPAPIEEDDL
jgi:hypothetical protein